MFKIEDFEHYQNQKLRADHAVLTWRKNVGYQFMFYRDTVSEHTIVGYRP